MRTTSDLQRIELEEVTCFGSASSRPQCMVGDAPRVFIVAPTLVMQAGLRVVLAATDVRVVGASATLANPDPLGVQVIIVADDELLQETAPVVAGNETQALLLLSGDDRSVAKLRTLSLRGWGVVPPDALPAELEAAVFAVAQGLVVLPRPLTDRVLQQPATFEELTEPLTTRECEVLELLGQGLSNKSISCELHISEHTVKFHVSSICTKLGVNSRTGAVSSGVRCGLIFR